MLVFGPVPSRRLGSSLGINHIPPKNCSFACVYCQVGSTTKLITERQEFYSADVILEEVERKIVECEKIKKPIDFLTLVPDGEPTLDINLRQLILGLKQFRIPVAVISNASIIDRNDVQEDLQLADWVSVKVDSVIETEWRQINRPYRRLSLTDILDGIMRFRKIFHGHLVTETMLVAGVQR